MKERKYCPSSALHEESKEQQNAKLYSQNVMKMTKAKKKVVGGKNFQIFATIYSSLNIFFLQQRRRRRQTIF